MLVGRTVSLKETTTFASGSFRSEVAAGTQGTVLEREPHDGYYTRVQFEGLSQSVLVYSPDVTWL